MIVIKIQGGLGNQLFQYALGRALSLHYKVSLYLDISFFSSEPETTGTTREFELPSLNLPYKIATKTVLEKFSHDKLSHTDRLLIKFGVHGSFKTISESKFKFDETIFEKSNNMYLTGYWQSEKYFKAIEKTIRAHFSFEPLLNEKNQILCDRIKNTNSVSIHFRRGDYVTNQQNSKVHGTLPLGYYKNAINVLMSKYPIINLFVFSDDIEWVKSNFSTKLSATFVEGNSAIEDLALMSSCKHNILANSSFSWWGGWLNNNSGKTVIAPKNWFKNKPFSFYDLFPSQWIII